MRGMFHDLDFVPALPEPLQDAGKLSRSTRVVCDRFMIGLPVEIQIKIIEIGID